MLPFSFQTLLIASKAPFLRCSATGIWVSLRKSASGMTLV